jgi:hypothetical protein
LPDDDDDALMRLRDRKLQDIVTMASPRSNQDSNNWNLDFHILEIRGSIPRCS